MSAAIPTRPILRYHGGKWMLAPWIISYFPPHRVYTEAFGGGGSVLMRKPRCIAEVYNDLDGEIVNLFRVLRDESLAEDLRCKLALTPFARSEWREAFTAPAPLDPVESARRLLIRAAMSHGSSSFNAKHGSGFRNYSGKLRSGLPVHDWARYPDAVEAFCTRLRGVIIEDRPAVQVLTEHDAPDALHYVDPPYVLSTRGSVAGVRQKYKHELTDDGHRELAAALREMTGAVIVSGYPSDLYDRELFVDWNRVEREAFADGASERVEVLWMNDACAARQQAPGFTFTESEVAA